MIEQEFRRCLDEAIIGHDRLLNAFRQIEERNDQLQLGTDYIPLLTNLIYYRIYPVNAFALLVRIDVASAIDVLNRFYMGADVDLDNKFGGVSFELTGMFDELAEIGGNELLSRLLSHVGFAPDKLQDQRIRNALSNAFEVNEEVLLEMAGRDQSGS